MKIRIISLNELIYVLYFILMPILPEYFRLGDAPVFVFLGFLPMLLLLKKKSGSYRINKAYMGQILPLLLLAIVCFMAHNEYSSLARYIMFPIVSTFIIMGTINTRDQVRDTFRILAYVGLVMCIFGLVERLFKFNVFSLIENVEYGKTGTQPTYRNGIPRIEFSFGNPISAAIYMLFINCISFTLWRTEKDSIIRKRIYIITYFLSLLTIVLTDSRMCIMSCVMMQGLFFMRERWNKRAAIIFCIFIALLMDFTIGGVITQFLSKYVGLVADILENGAKTSDTNTLYRFALIPIFVPMIKEKFLFGYGNEFLNGYRFAILEGYASSIDNMFIESFVRHGVFGFAITIIPIIKMFGFSRTLRRAGNEMGYNFACMVIAYLINLFSVAQLGEQRLFYIIWGLLLVLCEIEKKETIKGSLL